jgi:DME family drug/metabolite transporter
LPRIGVAIASVVSLASAPIIVALITAVQTRRRPSLPVTLALAFAIAGIVLIGNVSQDGQRPDVVGGALLAFLAGAVYAVNTLVGRRLGREGRVHPAQTAAFGFAFGALILLVFALTTGGLVIRYPAEGWLRLAYLGLFLTALGYGLLYAGMRWTSATAASIATLMEPVTSTVIAVVVFREPLGWSALLGIALLLASIIVLVLDREER